MPQIALTDKNIAKLPHPDKGTVWYSHNGDKYRGLHLAVGKTSKTFYAKKRVPGGNRIITQKLDRHPKLSLDAAYAKVRQLVNQIEGGQEDAHEIATFADAFGWHLQRSRKRPLTESTKEGYRQIYKVHLQPLAMRPLEAIKQPEVERLLASKTPSIQGYCVRVIKAAFESARKGGRRDLINPAEFIEPPELSPRDPKTQTDDLPTIWRDLEKLDAQNLSVWMVGMLTGIRHRSICRLRWTPDPAGYDGHLDLDKRAIVLPRMKNQQAREIPVAGLVMDILKAQKGDDIWLFPSPTKEGVPVYRAKKIASAMFHDTRRHFTTCGGICQIAEYSLAYLRGDSVKQAVQGKAMAGYMGKTVDHAVADQIAACVLEKMGANEREVLAASKRT